MANGTDFAPLLTQGLHPMDLAQLHALCVAPFALSGTRQPIFDGLSNFLANLGAAGIGGIAWIDGSFVTEKVDPADCDLVFCIDGLALDTSPPAIADAVTQYFVTDKAAVRATFHCDVYLLIEYPPGHPLHAQSAPWRPYWLGQFCFDRATQPKGLAVVNVTAPSAMVTP